MGGSPLGQYSAIAAAVASLGVIAAAVLSHLIHPNASDPFLDALAFASFGVLIGQPIGEAQGRINGRAEGESTAVARINGALAQGHAANARLDAIGAPSAAAAAAAPSGDSMPLGAQATASPPPPAPASVSSPPAAPARVPIDDRERL